MEKNKEFRVGEMVFIFYCVYIVFVMLFYKLNFILKMLYLMELFSVFEIYCCVLGDDEWIVFGWGKLFFDIYLFVFKMINDLFFEGEKLIIFEECFVFEDSVLGVEVGCWVGMWVIWVFYLMLKKEYEGWEKEVLVGWMYEVGEVDMY